MKSMTGFGASEFRSEDFELSVIIKSVNNKFLDIKSSLPEEFYQFENKINQLIEKYIKRGTVYLKIFFTKNKPDDYIVNTKNLEKIRNIYNKIQTDLSFTNSTISIDNIIQTYEIIQKRKTDLDTNIQKKILDTIKQALLRHKEMAENEGKEMKKYIAKSIKTIEKSLLNIVEKYPLYKELLRERLKKAIENITSTPFDKETMQRFMIELSFYTEKYDVSEELIRLQSHIQSFKKTMKKKQPIGKKMNFILQEMRREINTTASKYNEVKIFDDIIIIKEEIEKIREIIQNVE